MRMASALVALSVAALTGGCLCGEQSETAFGVLLASTENPDVRGTVPMQWHGFVNRGGGGYNPDLIRVFMSHTAPRSEAAEMLEFYAPEGDVLDRPGEFVLEAHFNSGEECPSDYLEYDLTGLPAGEYTVVHRRSTSPELTIVPTETGWDFFDGEEALVAVLVLQ